MDTNILFTLAIAVLLGLLSTRVMKLIGLPNVTGYLIVGLIIGPYALGGENVLGIMTHEELDGLSIISTVALGFIGFSIGVEFKLDHIKEIGSKAITITMFQALAATLCVDVALIATAFLTGMPTYEALILGAIATATAPAATLMVVRQYKAKGTVTSTLLPVVALDDAVGLIVFAISNSIALSMASGETMSVMNFLVWPLCEIICSLLIGALLGYVLSLADKLFKSHDNRLITALICVMLCLGVCEIFVHLEEFVGFPFGLSDLLVCMMAGATFINTCKNAPETMKSIDKWTPGLLVLFFVLSGAELNVASFFEDPMLIVCILVYIIARCCGKYFGTMVGASVTKADPSVKKFLGITLFPQAGVAIGMATMCKTEFDDLAKRINDPAMADVGSKIVTVTMCAVLIYELVGPVLTKWALAKAGEISPENINPRKFADRKQYDHTATQKVVAPIVAPAEAETATVADCGDNK